MENQVLGCVSLRGEHKYSGMDKPERFGVWEAWNSIQALLALICVAFDNCLIFVSSFITLGSNSTNLLSVMRMKGNGM